MHFVLLMWSPKHKAANYFDLYSYEFIILSYIPSTYNLTYYSTLCVHSARCSHCFIFRNFFTVQMFRILTYMFYASRYCAIRWRIDHNILHHMYWKHHDFSHIIVQFFLQMQYYIFYIFRNNFCFCIVLYIFFIIHLYIYACNESLPMLWPLHAPWQLADRKNKQEKIRF